MTSITNVQAFEVMDSRGNPTVMAEVTLESGEMGARLCTIRSVYWLARSAGTA